MNKKINKLYDEGHIIKIFTARGQGSGNDFSKITKKQLKLWGVKYNELLEKPEADFYVDDKAMTPGDFLFFGNNYGKQLK